MGSACVDGIGDVMEELSSIILDQADRLLRQHTTKGVLVAAERGEWAASLWDALTEAGLPIALVPQHSGGIGLPPSDVAQLIRRSSYHSVPLPLAETMIANAIWAEAGGEALLKSTTLGPTNQTDRVTLTRGQNGNLLQGTMHAVPWGTRADTMLVLAQDERNGPVLCQLRREQLCSCLPRRNVAYEPRDTVLLDGVLLGDDQIRSAPSELHCNGLMIYGAAMRAQQMIGAMERCMDHAISHASERVQFGRPIGSFQAVQSMLAVAAGHLAAAVAAGDAAVCADGFAADAFAVAVAKARVGEAAAHVAAVSHQVLGAMGFTHEHPLHFATRRLWAWRDECGSEFYWQNRIGQTICAQGGDGFWSFLTESPQVSLDERLAPWSE